MAAKIRRDDEVIVLTGKDKGKRGKVSNVAIFNATTGKADRVGFRFEDGKKVRFFKSNSETIK